ncbi:hypothetical protein A5624_10620 [Mycobacterium sp. 1482292.6]|uniref:ESX secretion-associated protein EspG n=1 Tax=unclassified Mycobacterium TaxID=2642494 RepID=UPI0007FED1BD|nr:MULTISPECIES: ESX secretion-associated protein EspG [unclassified Mycobacterium]OBJ12692.1 hypothetical protein A5624_10620 [Mycobacterium sp. 1482292.6]OBJ24813.1 hypothetical protein A5622_11200 [Mycobacterium sp. 1245801.1]
MTAALSHELTLTDDQFRVAASCVGLHDLPAVLASRSRHTTIDRREAAIDTAVRELVGRNLIVAGDLHPELVPVLEALQRPDRELAMRLVTPDGTAGVSVARRGTLCVLARRIADDILLRIIGRGVELREVSTALLAELPRAKPAEVQPVGAPLLDMVESLSGTHDPVQLADRIRFLGAESYAANLLGSALASRRAFAEIVYYALAGSDDRISRGPAAVAVFYTRRGRIISAPSASPTGQLWSTLKAGSDQAVGQAIAQLVNLAEEKWGEL